MNAKRWGCTICGQESRTEREAEKHFDSRHKGKEYAEEQGWVDYFLGRKKRKENRNVGSI